MSEIDRAEMRSDLDEASRNIRVLMEGISEIARWYYLAYEALLKAGFSEDQAMKLVCERGYGLVGES